MIDTTPPANEYGCNFATTWLSIRRPRLNLDPPISACCAPPFGRAGGVADARKTSSLPIAPAPSHHPTEDARRARASAGTPDSHHTRLVTLATPQIGGSRLSRVSDARIEPKSGRPGRSCRQALEQSAGAAELGLQPGSEIDGGLDLSTPHRNALDVEPERDAKTSAVRNQLKSRRERLLERHLEGTVGVSQLVLDPPWHVYAEPTEELQRLHRPAHREGEHDRYRLLASSAVMGQLMGRSGADHNQSGKPSLTCEDLCAPGGIRTPNLLIRRALSAWLVPPRRAARRHDNGPKLASHSRNLATVVFSRDRSRQGAQTVSERGS